MDRYVERKSTGLLGNIGESIKGVAIGLLLFVASFPLLWWNEGRADLSQMARKAEIAPPDAPSPALEGKLISVSATVSSVAPLEDPLYLNPGPYMALTRDVEVFAWIEKKETREEKKVGGGKETTTTYTYEKAWTRDPKDGSEFRYPEGHRNPPPVARPDSFKVPTASVGGYTFAPAEASLPAGDALPLTPEVLKPGFRIDGQYLYIGVGSNVTPVLGDARLTFRALKPGFSGTLFGKATGGAVTAYANEDGDKLFRLFRGSRDEAIATLASEHKMITWVLRGLGFFLMWVGMMLFFGPVNAVLDILPFLGSAGRLVVGLASLPIALVLSVVTILIAIVFHSPLLLAGVIAALVIGAIVISRRRRARAS
jgi:hypothetical protein